jgi:hypothetical protein
VGPEDIESAVTVSILRPLIVDQFGGNFVQAEIIKAFIESSERRQRFGSN